ncbi:hypothetical protein AMR42_08505 [Limnothrix sp. PR1529]|nr:hypothetical protein BCR12_15210 [Limnothrix sp. P13C2]PIB13600.1 hypothetical protein AMR42_08505 [Limnothrix sp. PR1529]
MDNEPFSLDSSKKRQAPWVQRWLAGRRPRPLPGGLEWIAHQFEDLLRNGEGVRSPGWGGSSPCR